MTHYSKFSFQTSFEEQDMVRFSPQYSPYDKEIFEEEAFQKGYEKGLADALQRIEALNQNQLECIAQKLSDLLVHHQQSFGNLQKDVSFLAKKMAETLFPATAEKVAIPELESLLTYLAPMFQKHPYMIIKASSKTLEGLAQKWQRLAAQFSHKISVTFEKDDAIPLTDVRLFWEGGGLHYEQKRAFQDIYDALDRYACDMQIQSMPLILEQENRKNDGEGDDS